MLTRPPTLVHTLSRGQSVVAGTAGGDDHREGLADFDDGVSVLEVGITNTHNRVGEYRLQQARQVFSGAVESFLSSNKKRTSFQGISVSVVPTRSQHSQDVLAGEGVDEEGEALVGLVHHDEVEVVPGDAPPLLPHLVVPQLGQLVTISIIRPIYTFLEVPETVINEVQVHNGESQCRPSSRPVESQLTARQVLTCPLYSVRW